MVAHEAAKFYMNQPNTYAVTDVREEFGGELLIVEGKAYIAFNDESTLSIERIVRAKFQPNGNRKEVLV